MLESSQRLRDLTILEKKLGISPNQRLFNPLRMSLPDGDLAVLDDLFSLREYNNLMRHFPGAGAISNPQSGVIQFYTGITAWKGYTGAVWNELVVNPMEKELDAAAHTIGFTLQTGIGDGTTTIDWRLGNKYEFTYGAQNETFTFTAPTKACNLMLALIQDGVGGRTPTMPGTVKYPGDLEPNWSSGAGKVDLLGLFWNGSVFRVVASLKFSA